MALVTGAAHGLGATITEGLASGGAAVVLGDLDLGAAEARAAGLRAQGKSAIALELDVTAQASIGDALKAARRQLGPVDVLVNNAGLKGEALTSGRRSEQLATSDWQRMVDVNLNGVFYCCQAVYGDMASRGRGSIINVASIYGLVASRIGPNSPYAATKAGIIGLTRALAVEWAPAGIRVNAIAPTHIEPRSDEDRPSSAASAEHEQRIRWRTPLGRRGRQDEIAGPVVFLASDASSLVTGHTLALDGGWLAW
ncbi:MAG TPA: SDR family oxidoreductase [Chloroflexota bacterium]|nr:SDR family oxidoreductase [Chloroflexota bacterium]